jgi:hypothetical protein
MPFHKQLDQMFSLEWFTHLMIIVDYNLIIKDQFLKIILFGRRNDE